MASTTSTPRTAVHRPAAAQSGADSGASVRALFMVIEHATPDKAIAALEQYGGTVIKTSLGDLPCPGPRSAQRRPFDGARWSRVR